MFLLTKYTLKTTTGTGVPIEVSQKTVAYAVIEPDPAATQNARPSDMRVTVSPAFEAKLNF